MCVIYNWAFHWSQVIIILMLCYYLESGNYKNKTKGLREKIMGQS